MTDFMNEYTSFAYTVPDNKDRSERVADLKRTFELLSNVYRTFDSLMRAVFVDGEQLPLLRRFTWLLFLIARGMPAKSHITYPFVRDWAIFILITSVCRGGSVGHHVGH